MSDPALESAGMSSGGRVLRVLPDGERVEEALVAASADTGFADASAFLSFSQFISRFEGARLLDRRPATPLTSRVVLWSAARKLGHGPLGAFVHEPAFARAALDLVFDLKAGAVSPYAFVRAVRAGGPVAASARAVPLPPLHRLRRADGGPAARGPRGRGARCARRAPHARAAGVAPALRADSSLRQLHDFSRCARLRARARARLCESGVPLRLCVPGAGSPQSTPRWTRCSVCSSRRGQELTHLEAQKSDLVDEGRRSAAWGGISSRRRCGRSPAGAGAGARAVLRRLCVRGGAAARAPARALVDGGVPPEQVAIAYRDLGEEAERLVEALEALQLPSRLRRGAPFTSTAAGRVAL